MKHLKIFALILVLTSCTTAQVVNTSTSGKKELIVACGLIVNTTVCHRRAIRECPNGYKTLSTTMDLNRKELHIQCK